MGAITKAVNNNKQIAAAAEKKTTTRDLVKAMMPRIRDAIPNVGITPERFLSLTLTALSANPALQKCDQTSFLAAMMTAAQLGVEPNTPIGSAWLIPYGNRVQFQLGYKGLIDLAYRTGNVSTIYAETVYDADEFEYEMGLDCKLIHKPFMGENRGKAVAYYAVVKTKDGGYSFAVMSRADVMEHAKRFSKSVTNGPWVSAFDEMAKKTVLKKLMKYMPLSSDMQHAVAADYTIKNDISAEVDAGDIIYGEQGDADDSEFIGAEEQDFPPYEPDAEPKE